MPPKDIGQSPPAASGLVPVAIYTRVSTDNQIGGRFDSCESQAAVCRDQIVRHAAEGWHEVACFTDAAYSGSTMNRPGIKALKRMIESGEVKVVLIYKLERVLRSTDEWIPFRGFLQKHGCRLESATEDLSENTPSGRLKNNLLMSVAEYERLNTAEKTRAKMHEQAKRGLWNGGNVPFGYTYDKNTQTLQPHPTEAPLLVRIFEQAAKLVPLQQIANALNAEGHRTKERIWRRRSGEAQTVGQRIFRSDGLRIIIKNPLYRAAVRFGGEEYAGKHPALVSPELWEKANAAISPVNHQPANRLQDRDTHHHLLKGLVHCACCQRRLIPTDSTKHAGAGKVYRYYACGSLLKERQACPVGRISANALEKTVISFLCEVSKHPAVTAAALQHAGTLQAKERPLLVTELATLQSRLDAVTKKLRHCLQTVEEGGVEVFGSDLRSRAAELRAEKDQLLVSREQKQRQIHACDATKLGEKRVLDALNHLAETFPTLAPATQKEFVRVFVERIDVRKRIVRPRESARMLEITLRLHVPRLIEGKATIHRSTPDAQSMVLEAKVDFTRASHGEVTIHAPYQQTVRLGKSQSHASPPPKISRTQHPIHTALRWQSLLADGSIPNRASLARKFSLTRAGVTQHLELLKLHPEIQNHLTKLRTASELQRFSLNRMRQVAHLSFEKQLAAFARLQQPGVRLSKG